MAETIGSLVDKISIAALKLYHMREQVARRDAPPGHKRACRAKVSVLELQRTDLEIELSELLQNVAEGATQLKVYYQFKMYNDPKYRTNK